MLYLIEIENKADALDFLAWLGQLKIFPTSIYLGGFTYTFKDETQKDLFQLGFHSCYDCFFDK